MIPPSACPPWRPDRQLNPAQRCRCYTTRRGTIDRACDAAAFRAEMRAIGAIPVVPSRRGAKDPQPCPDYIYRHRNLIERCWSRLKEYRAVATRYDKTATSYAACIAIAASLDWIKSLISKSRNANG